MTRVLDIAIIVVAVVVGGVLLGWIVHEMLDLWWGRDDDEG